MNRNPIVLVHGLWDNPNSFNCLLRCLDAYNRDIYVPFLPSKGGKVSLNNLAENLNDYILDTLGDDQKIDLLGFSMGGLISRIWIQKFAGSNRVKKFLSVGSPHNGTLSAQLFPSYFFQGISQMKIRSPLLLELNSDFSCLSKIECSSFFCNLDLLVVPGWSAVLPVGNLYSVPVLFHKELITNSKSLELLSRVLIG